MVGGPNGYRHAIDYEYSERDRNRLVYRFATATDEEVEHVSQLVGVPNPLRAREERRAEYREEGGRITVAGAVAAVPQQQSQNSARQSPDK